MHRKLNGLALTIGALLFVTGVRPAGAVVMYDGAASVTPNQTPDQAPWRWGYQTLNKSSPTTPSQVTQSAANGVTTLDSTGTIDDVGGYTTHVANVLTSGYSYVRPDLQTLDATEGFTIGFTVKVDSEKHTSNDRAGFSVIALSSGATPTGVELGFWTNEVFAQNVGFTHGTDSVAFDTTTGLIDYQLHIQGPNYTLTANSAQILTGALRDYTSFAGGPPGNPGFPYNQPDLLFFGDDTSEADASVELGKITFTSDGAPSPWQNALPTDVDNNGTVTKNDATAVIQALNTQGIGPLAAPSGTPAAFVDVNGDNFLSPLDALIVINYLNTPPESASSAAVLEPSLLTAIAVPEPSAASYAWSVACCAFFGYWFRRGAIRANEVTDLHYTNPKR